jgi:GAF domain-containing protein
MVDLAGSDEQLRFERLQRLLLDSGDIARFLVELARLATTVIPEPVSCGITLRYEHGMMTAGSSDRRAEMLDETQYRNGDGPCMQSVRTGRAVVVHDLLLEERWSAYVADAITSGLRTSVSLPLSVNGQTFGAMNVYGFGAPDLFGPQAYRELEVFAAQAAGTLRVATRQTKDATLLAQMEESLSSRTVIDQALGIIMATQRCTATAAFELLRRESLNNHHRLREVAADLILRTTGRAPEQGKTFDPS